jgi:ABC-type multidrug transport system fused ATPase/permease subunit
VALATILLLAALALQLLAPQVLRAFIDTARAGGSAAMLTQAALFFLVAAVGAQIVVALAGYYSEDVGWTATNRLRADLARHCLALDPGFYQAHTPGELIERVDGDVALLADLFSQVFVNVIGNGLLLVGILLLVAREDLRIGLALALYTALVVAMMRWLQRRAVPVFIASRQASAEMSGFLGEYLGAREDIAANGAAGYILRRFEGLQRLLNRAAIRVQMMACVIGGSLNLLTTLGSALALTLGAYFLAHGTMTLGTVFLLYSYTALLIDRLITLNEHFDTLQQAAASLKRISELFQTPVRVREVADMALAGLTLPNGALSLAFENVTFCYAVDAPPALSGVSFALEPGEVAGLVGRTGSGKTTITRLLDRFYDPERGIVRLGGQDIRQLPVADLRSRIGLVTQEVQLFHATVRDNLTFFDAAISDEQLLAAIEQLGLGEWLARLPDGLDSDLSPETLSAGEAQLLAFIRVLLRDPQLVILDEASARLDPATERLLMRAIAGLFANRTGLLIAHRLTTLAQVDRILVLEAGALVEDGSRVALAQNPDSYYARLLRTAALEGVLV